MTEFWMLTWPIAGRTAEVAKLCEATGWDGLLVTDTQCLAAEAFVQLSFCAAATQRIRLGTGVSSLPYHHPFILADRVQQLDYQLKGRFMFGVGPGSLPSDAFMMGIDPLRQRDMMEEALDVLIPLLRGEAVTKITDWFSVKEARLQLMPYTRPHVEMAVAAQISPAGPRAAGKHGIGMLSIGSTTSQGYMALSAAWGICEELAREHKQAVSRHHWRLVAPMHVAETREKALENVRFGLGQWVRYFTEVIALPFEIKGTSIEDKCAQLIESGYAVIGDPDDAAAQLERLDKQSGGFGCFLQLAHNWADFPQTLRSYELIARYVMPRFQGLNPGRQASLDWTAANREKFMNAGRQAKVLATEKHLAERRGKPSA